MEHYLVWIEERGYELRYDGHRRSMVIRTDGMKFFDGNKETSNVLAVRVVVNHSGPCSTFGVRQQRLKSS